MNLLQRIRNGGQEARSIGGVDDFLQALQVAQYSGGFGLTGNGVQQTLGGQSAERITTDFVSLASQVYGRNSVIFACMLARQSVFSQVRFQWQALNKGRPSELFSTPELAQFETPWEGGTTGDLLARTINDADLSGNCYWTSRAGELIRLRPDWLDIVLESRVVGRDPDTGDVQVLGSRKLGYLYSEGGRGVGDPVPLMLGEVAHFAPIPDPLATFRGMSWLTPLIREVQADDLMTRHKHKFFENGATVNLVVKHDATVTPEKARLFREMLDEQYAGVDNAYKIMHLGGGADVSPVGANLEQVEFQTNQSHGEPLALDTPIPTPTGWTTMGEIQPGDRVIGRDGRPANVVGRSPVHHDRPCFRVTFHDGTAIVADAGHIWVAIDRNTAKRAERTYTTAELAELVAEPAKGQARRMSVPLTPALDLPEADLLVDPYVLGCWLGDGQTAGAAICGAADDLKFIGDQIEQRGYSISQWSVRADRVPVIGIPGGLLSALDALGVLGNKAIPAPYMRGSLDQRLALLQGLMDTDGSIGHAGKATCEFSSKFEHLARQVAELARSLGYRAPVTSKPDARSRTGSTWMVRFRADPDRMPFRLPRKVERVREWGAPHVRSRSILSVEPVESVPVRCIAVDTADHLFLAGDTMVPTHNTRIAAAAGVPPVIVGLSKGLESSTYSNYSQARRRFADGTLHPLWSNMVGSMQRITSVPNGSRLWYDTRDVPFLREDSKDAAEIAQIQASTMRTLIEGGYDPQSVQRAVMSGDYGLLSHTGLVSVQLQRPGSENPAPSSATPAKPDAPAKPAAKPATTKSEAKSGGDPATNGRARSWEAANA